MFKKKFKAFQRALARFGLYYFHWLFSWLPFGVVRFFMRILLVIGFTFTVKQKRLARESLSLAFGPEKSAREINALVKKNFQTLGKGMVEMAYFLSHTEWSKRDVVFEGKEHLDRALAQGKGVVAVTAHFGNFPLMMLRCAQEGYATSCIQRPIRDEELEVFLFRKRKECGLKTVYAIPRKACVVQALKVLRDQELLFIPLDQNFGSNGGIYVDFFGRKAATATGPVVFSMRTGAPILPMFIVRQPDDTHKIMIEPPLAIETGRDEEETILMTVSKITRLIEEYIRRYPHEWGWMHRRWKTRPQEDVLASGEEII